MSEQSRDTPFWKKEISFSRKRDAKPAADVAPSEQAVPAQSAEPHVPFWKKEISFKRKPAAAQSAPQVDAEPTPALYVDDDTAAAVELVNAYVQDTAPAPEPVAYEPVADPPVAEAPAPVELFAVPEPPPAAAPPEITEVLPVVPPAEPAPIPPAPPAAQAPVPAPPAEAVAVPTAAASTPAPVVVHPPVPAAALPPLDDDAAPRKKKKEKQEKQAAGERVPFYRRELSFGRKKGEEPAKAAKASPTAGETPAEEQAEKPKRERRSLSLPRPQLPSRGGGGARAGKLPKRLVGLKIGSSQIAAATVANNGHAEVLQLARESLDPGVVANGELREPDLLAEALKEFFKKHNLPRRGVRLGIATNRIGVRTLEIGGIDDPKQLANAIKFRAQEALPIPIDEAVLDYQVLREDTNEEGETVRKILLVLAYRDLIDRYVDACRKAGIQLIGIDLEAFALVRALAAPREEDTPAQSALVAVTIGHDRATFAVSDGRVCEFTRVLDWGGQALNVAVARALDRAPSEVDEIKHQLTLNGHEVPEGLSPEQATTAREALRKQVQAFARELVSSLQFYQNQPGSLGIGEIVVTGGTAHLGGFADELQRLIGVRVRIGHPLVRVKTGKKFSEPEQLGSLAVAIGLGIED